MATTSRGTRLDVAAIRRDFPIFETGIVYLDSANTSQRPRQVTDAMLDYFQRYNSNIHRAAYKIAEEATERYEGTREKVRAFINAASTKEIIYTRGTTEAINLVAYSWGRKNIKKGDLIVLTILDHHSNIVPWQILAAASGATIEYVDIDERGELRLDQFYELLKRSPKLVAFSQVSNALGTINPAGQMVAAAKAAGATVLVDGAQGAPHQGVDVQALGCDFYAFSGHKMLGPTGAGILYGRRELLEAMDPFMSGGDMIKTVRVEGTTYHDLPWKFEAGTQAIGEVIGLGAAVDYLSGLGMEAVRAHEREITEYAYEVLSDIEGLTFKLNDVYFREFVSRPDQLSYIRHKVTLRISANHRGRFLATYNVIESRQLYRVARTQVDLKMLYTISKRFDVYLDVNNLLAGYDRQSEFEGGRPERVYWLSPSLIFGTNVRF